MSNCDVHHGRQHLAWMAGLLGILLYPHAALAHVDAGEAGGLAQGLLGSSALLATNESVVTLLGITTSVFVVALLVSAVVISLRPVWTRIAVRVAGSWIVAVGLLMLGWMFRSAG